MKVKHDMEPHEKIYNECVELMEIATLANDVFIDNAIKGSVKGMADELYEVYSKAKGLRIKGSEEKFRADTIQYNNELITAKKIVEARAPYYSEFIYTKDDDHWVHVAFDKNNYKPASFRLYLNIKIFKFAYFIRNFWVKITNYISCPCGGKAKYESYEKKVICKTCKKDDFYFAFKFHVPLPKTETYRGAMSELLRHDKIVMYFPDEESAKAMARTLKEYQNLFEPKTMPLTGEIFPGLGFAIEPTAEEKEEYIAATGDEQVSFGAYISRLMGELIIKAVQNKRVQVELTYKNWKAKYPERMGKTDAERYKERTILYNHIYPLIADNLRALIAGEVRFKRYFDELAELERLAA